MSLAACRSCPGFLPLAATSCPHCGARASRAPGTSTIQRGLAGAFASGLFSVLLMACYGQPPVDPCPDGPDTDGDGYPSAGSLDNGEYCDPQPHQDCDDTKKDIHPGAADPFGDGIDQNCDGHDGEECEKVDEDQDGHYVWHKRPDCWVPDTQPDCDDHDATIYPGAREIPGDGIDQDCDGKDNVACKLVDRDGDGYLGVSQSSPSDCVMPAGFDHERLDCDDGAADVHPHAHTYNCGVQ